MHIQDMSEQDMSKQDMDLDINNYTPTELRTFFSIKPGQTYTSAEIELRAYEIRERLVSGKHVRKGQMRQFITFMSAASAALTATISGGPTSDKLASKQPSQNQVQTIIASTPYVAPNEFYVKTQTQMVSIDTRFRENAYSTSASNFTVSLPTKLSKVVTIEVSSFEMSIDEAPNVYQAIRNNFFVIRLILNSHLTDGGSILEHTVTVPDGYYSTTEQLVAAIRESIYAASVAEYHRVGPYDHNGNKCNGNKCNENEQETLCAPICGNELFQTIYMTTDDCSGCVHLYTESPYIQAIELDFSKDEEGDSDRRLEYYTKLGRLLGFTRRKYRGKQSYTGETKADPFLCGKYFYIEIADFQNQYAPTFIPAFSNMNLSSSVIAKIVRNTNDCRHDLTLITEPRVYFGPTDINRIQIRILDAYGNVMDLAKADYSFTLRIRYMYDSALVKK